MWFTKGYIHRRDWILDHYNQLRLTPETFLIVSLIDYANQNQLPVTNDWLAQKSKMKPEALDQAISQLLALKILKVETTRESVEFNIEAIFSMSNPYEFVTQDLLERFEAEFARPLSQNELSRLNKLRSNYPEKSVIFGLKEAFVQGKLSMSYIEKVVHAHEQSKIS